MPIKSQKQRVFFQMCKHVPSKVKGKCPPLSVINEFLHPNSTLAQHRKRHNIK